MKKNDFFLRMSKNCCNFARFFDGGAFCVRTKSIVLIRKVVLRRLLV